MYPAIQVSLQTEWDIFWRKIKVTFPPRESPSPVSSGRSPPRSRSPPSSGSTPGLLPTPEYRRLLWVERQEYESMSMSRETRGSWKNKKIPIWKENQVRSRLPSDSLPCNLWCCCSWKYVQIINYPISSIYYPSTIIHYPICIHIFVAGKGKYVSRLWALSRKCSKQDKLKLTHSV